eukprot:2488824-Rhodomonas_salina.1
MSQLCQDRTAHRNRLTRTYFWTGHRVGQQGDAFLVNIGHRTGEMARSPMVVTVTSARSHRSVVCEGPSQLAELGTRCQS